MRAIFFFAAALLAGSPAFAQCPNQVASINPQVGQTLHIEFADPANCTSVLPPSGLMAAGSPNPSGFVAITADATGLNFKGLAAGQFTYTITDPVGPSPFPATTLVVTVGPIPTAIVPLLQ